MAKRADSIRPCFCLMDNSFGGGGDGKGEKMGRKRKERLAIMLFFLYNKLIEFLLFVRELACI